MANITFAPVQTDADHLRFYAQFLARIFAAPKKFTTSYLHWLYVANPSGTAVGFDAWQERQLAAHFACIPLPITWRDRVHRGLLAVNTATAPALRGQGLFPQLAQRTLAAAKQQGFDIVLAVSNQASTGGFVTRLGFTLVGPLAACLGFGRQTRLSAPGAFRVGWDESGLAWRCANPVNAVQAVRRQGHVMSFFARTHWRPVVVRCELVLPWQAAQGSRREPPLRLFLGHVPGGRGLRFGVPIPQRLRPSVLNFVLLSLREDVPTPAKKELFFTFLDFDAY